MTGPIAYKKPLLNGLAMPSSPAVPQVNPPAPQQPGPGPTPTTPRPPVPQVNPPAPTTPVQYQPGVQTNAITPGQDLRGQQITAGSDPRLGATQGMVNGAAGAVSGFNYQPYSAYQAQAAPYNAASAALTNQATQSGNAQQGYLGQAAGQLGGLGFGQYGNINPTITGGSSVGAGHIGGPQYTQGNLQLPGVSTGPLSGLANLAFNQDTNAMRGQLGSSLAGLSSSPDRSKLASDAFNLLQEQQAPRLKQQERELGQSAGAFGRMGSGLVNTQLADLGTAYKTSQDQAARGLAGDAAAQTLSDRLAIANAQSGGLGQFAGLDTSQNSVANQNTLNTFQGNMARDSALNANALNQGQFNAGRDDARNQANYATQSANAGNQLQAAGMNADLAREAFSQQSQNRNFAFGADQAKNQLGLDKLGAYRGLGSDSLARGGFQAGLADQAFGQGQTALNNFAGYDQRRGQLGFDQLGALSGLEAQQFNQGASGRNELRGERDYQNQLSTDAYQRALAQFNTEQGAQQDAFGNQATQVGQLGSLGNSVDPTRALQGQADTLNQQGGDAVGGYGQYLAQLAAQQALQKPPAPGAPRPMVGGTPPPQYYG